MSNPDSATVNTTGNKFRFWNKARAVIIGLALVLPGAAALAINDPIPGIDIVVNCLGCKPPIHGIATPTGADGAYQFKGLAPGKYDLSVGGKLVQTIKVDTGNISGILSKQPDGTASITFNGQVGPVEGKLAGAPINTSRSNIKHPSKVAENESPRPTNKATIVSTGASGQVQASPKNRDKEPGISDQGAIGGLTSYATAPPHKDGAGKRPGLAGPGDPIPGTEVGLEGDPEGIKVSAQSDAKGAFHFDKLPAGKYKLTLPGLPAKLVTVSADGKFGGKVMRGPDGSIGIWDDTDITHATTAKASSSAPQKASTGSITIGGTAPRPLDIDINIGGGKSAKNPMDTVFSGGMMNSPGMSSLPGAAGGSGAGVRP